MEKKIRPVQQAANNIDIRGSDVTPPAPTTQVNHNADAGGYQGLSQQEIADILKLYPDAFNAA
ncbi:hypothetical protein F9C28_17630 [Shimwellia pseudoproteus]|uniref:hypothetical protein n=1 Tax=Shimwellia pseudoproteus TaxID=570012 RepID=UPI0018EC117D|nr:hypothetical protein [Shimwellia pseudoproteus]MBJ3816683.1 hypothetical protein [Shimwellia pseudoproteus]